MRLMRRMPEGRKVDFRLLTLGSWSIWSRRSDWEGKLTAPAPCHWFAVWCPWTWAEAAASSVAGLAVSAKMMLMMMKMRREDKKVDFRPPTMGFSSTWSDGPDWWIADTRDTAQDNRTDCTARTAQTACTARPAWPAAATFSAWIGRHLIRRHTHPSLLMSRWTCLKSVRWKDLQMSMTLRGWTRHETRKEKQI